VKQTVYKKTDIIHVISGDLWAGAAVQVYQTLSNMGKDVKTTVLAVLFNDGNLNKKLIANGVPTLVIDEKSESAFKIITKLAKIIRNSNCKILHVHAYKEHVLGQLAAILSGRKCFLFRTFHGRTATPKDLSFVREIKSKIIHRIEMIFLNHHRINIIAVSEDLEKFLVHTFPKAQITQIYNSVHSSDMTDVDRDEIRNGYNVNSGALWIGTLARLVEIKNLTLLIELGKRLISLNIKFRISIFGEGPLQQNLQNKIDAYGLGDFVALEGFSESSLSLLKSFDIFTLTSFHEGLPMSLLEAMSVGTPVVCTNVGGIAEAVENETSGILVESNNVNVLAEAILRIYKDISFKEKIVSNALTSIDNKFNVYKNNAELFNLYKKQLKQ